jgi:hypothetical protein
MELGHGVKYLAFHEAGHAICICYSKNFQINRALIDSGADSYVSPSFSESDSNRQTQYANAEAALISLAGEMSGNLYFVKNQIFPSSTELYNINARLETDRQRFQNHLAAINCGHLEADFRRALAEFLDRSEVWGFINELADALQYFCGKPLDGAQIEIILEGLPFHRGLPIPEKAQIQFATQTTRNC